MNSAGGLMFSVTPLGAGVPFRAVPLRRTAGPLKADAREEEMLTSVAAPVPAMVFFPLISRYHIGQMPAVIDALFIIAWIA